MKINNSLSRRNFLKNSMKGLATSALLPTIITSPLFSQNSPNNRITLGFIGVGNMGGGNLRAFLNQDGTQVVAVCDVDEERRLAAKNAVDKFYKNSDCQAFNDFREITQNPAIDAVVISTPDHWHTIPAIDAAIHGKDMYVEKPLTLTINEGRLLANAINRFGRILQTGSHQRSDADFRFACELVRNGRIGKVHTVEVTIPGNNKTCGTTWEAEPVPKGFDYNFWLGPANWEPYNELRCHYTFRFILDYSGGQVTNWGAHYLDIAQWGLDMDNSGPVEITGRGAFPTTGLFTTATEVDFDCVFANGVKLTCKTGGSGTKFIGTEGSVFVNREKLITEPAFLAKEIIKPNEIHLYESNSHHRNFLNCIRNRQKTVANEEIGHRASTLCHLGNMAMLLKTTLRWDPVAEKFIGNEVANAMLSRPLRAPWQYNIA
ncbi:Gfo/Idh/MocA family oxidoreductase [candidate division KSB1 bacterium]|nr:Gfo/Idh/MocA family oxidoreductase [candidate division KSB1 bacterium]